jgi:hypothetical protein
MPHVPRGTFLAISPAGASTMRRLSLSLLLALPFFARAADRTLELTVAAGEYDRKNVPVCVPLVLADDLLLGSVTLLDAEGREMPGQITSPGLGTLAADPKANAELHFILPGLKAGGKLAIKAVIKGEKPAPAKGFTWIDRPGEPSELRYGDLPVLRYECRTFDDSTKEKRFETFKPFHHLYDPQGKRTVTNGVGEKYLYPHHRGIFYGFNKVTYGQGKKADVWHCTGDAHQSNDRLLASDAGGVLGRHRVQIGWHGEKKETFAVEERELTVYHVPGGRLVEFSSKLEAKIAPVKLDGDPQHAGFHFRADNEVVKTKDQTYYLRPDGKGKPGDTRNWDPKTKQGPVDLPWDAMCFVLGGQRYTVVYLDKPTNPKEARGSERDYGRFGNYFEYELTEKKPLLVNYRLWLQEGEMTGEQAEALSRDFVKPVSVTVK